MILAWAVWAFPAIVALAALVVGLFLGWSVSSDQCKQEFADIMRAQAIDRRAYLGVLRREIANLLIWDDPDRYLALYNKLLAEIDDMRTFGLLEIQHAHARLCKKYPNYLDFDKINLREFVNYKSAYLYGNFEELSAIYRDIIIFTAQKSILEPFWLPAELPNAHELEVLITQVRSVHDTKLKIKLEMADAIFSVFRFGDGIRDMTKGGIVFENSYFSVTSIPDNNEVKYGFTFKHYNEHVISTSFVADKSNIYRSYYRSDADFKTGQSLFDDAQITKSYLPSTILGPASGVN